MAAIRLTRSIRRNAVAAILIISYLFMALLVIEQGRVIESQKTLIHTLFSDTMELSAAKMRALESGRRR